MECRNTAAIAAVTARARSDRNINGLEDFNYFSYQFPCLECSAGILPAVSQLTKMSIAYLLFLFNCTITMFFLQIKKKRNSKEYNETLISQITANYRIISYLKVFDKYLLPLLSF